MEDIGTKLENLTSFRNLLSLNESTK